MSGAPISRTVTGAGRPVVALAVSCFLAVAFEAAASAHGTGAQTVVIDVSGGGMLANGSSMNPGAVSATGRYVAFVSTADNLSPRQPYYGTLALYLRDRGAGSTRLASVSSGGVASAVSGRFFWDAAVTPDGRFVVFSSADKRLDPTKTTGWTDVFVHDMTTGRTSRVSVASNGQAGNSDSFAPSISADGRYVAFSSDASDLVAGDTNRVRDVFVHDRVTGATRLIDRGADGRPLAHGAGALTNQALSADGSVITYADGVGAAHPQVHLRDLHSGADRILSLDGHGRPAGAAQSPELSGDGRYVQFISTAVLAVGGRSGRANLYRRTVATGKTLLAGTMPGVRGASCIEPSLSSNGWYAAYTCTPTGSTPPVAVYRHDLGAGALVRVDLNQRGQPSDTGAQPMGVADSGLSVFISSASDLGPSGYRYHVYARTAG